MHSYLTKILQAKKQEVTYLHDEVSQCPNLPLAKIYHGKLQRQASCSFKKALAAPGLSVIAEIKRRSPSKQHLADIPDVAALAKQYIDAGASAISVLTDASGFGGSIDDLMTVTRAIETKNIPVLRKDFMIDAIQIAEAIVAGADAVLLIVAVLGDKTAKLLQQAQAMNIEALVEVHNLEELKYAVSIGADIIGINNRHLHTFEVDTNTATSLYPHLPQQVISVAESGIQGMEQAMSYAKQGFNSILVGESLVKSVNLNHTMQELTYAI